LHIKHTQLAGLLIANYRMLTQNACLCICVQVLTLKLDTKYWPSWELRRNPDTATWERHLIAESSDKQQQQPQQQQQQQPPKQHTSTAAGLAGATGGVASAAVAVAAAGAAPAGVGSAACSAPMLIDATTGAS
jgi:hypothetical protein